MDTKIEVNPNINRDSLWLSKNFLFLWFGKIVSNLGSQIYFIALPLLIYDLSKSALAMSTMRAIDFFPNIILGMLIGVMVDRFSRKHIMLLTSVVQMIILGLMIFLIFVESIQVWHLYIMGFILSSAGYAFGNSQHSIIPQMVSKDQLTLANAKLSFVDTLISMIGPGIAGFLIALYSYELSLSIYLFCLILLFFFIQFLNIPPSEIKRAKNTTIWYDMKEGIDELLQNKLLLTPTLIVFFNNFASSLVLGVLVFYAADILHATEKQIGLMFSMGAIGGLLGSMVVNRLKKKFGRGKCFVWSLFFAAIAWTLLFFSYSWWLVGLAILIRTFGVTISNIVYFTFRQEFTPNHLLGRVAGTSSMIMKLSVPLGFFVAGIWAEFFPVQGLFIISTVMVLIFAVFTWNNKIVEVK
jgi:MFS family permease